MAIAVAGITTHEGIGRVMQFDHATPAGDDRALLLVIGTADENIHWGGLATYGGLDIDQYQEASAGGTGATVAIWLMGAPAVGTAEVYVELDFGGAGTEAFVAHAIALTGVTGQDIADINALGTSAAPSGSATVPDGDTLFAALALATDVAADVGAGGTEVVDAASTNGASADRVRVAVGTWPGDGGSETAAWSLGASRAWALAAVALTGDPDPDVPLGPPKASGTSLACGLGLGV